MSSKREIRNSDDYRLGLVTEDGTPKLMTGEDAENYLRVQTMCGCLTTSEGRALLTLEALAKWVLLMRGEKCPCCGGSSPDSDSGCAECGSKGWVAKNRETWQDIITQTSTSWQSGVAQRIELRTRAIEQERTDQRLKRKRK